MSSGQNLGYAALILLALALIGTGIWRQERSANPGQTAAQNEALTASLVENASIQPTIESRLGSVVLAGGVYDWKSADASGKVGLFGDYLAFGDLTGGGQTDAAAVIYETNGGHGAYYSVIALKNENGKAVFAGTAYLGEDVQIKSLSIENGDIAVDYLTQRKDDFIVKPTLEVKEKYKLTAYGLELQ